MQRDLEFSPILWLVHPTHHRLHHSHDIHWEPAIAIQAEEILSICYHLRTTWRDAVGIGTVYPVVGDMLLTHRPLGDVSIFPKLEYSDSCYGWSWTLPVKSHDPNDCKPTLIQVIAIWCKPIHEPMLTPMDQYQCCHMEPFRHIVLLICFVSLR